MDEVKKIALVIPSLQAGGMERVMSELANYFSLNNSIEVHLIILGKNLKFYDISNKVVIHEPDFYFDNKYKIYHTIKTIVFLRYKIKAINPYSILSFGEMYNSFVLLSTLFLKVKVYVSDRSKPDKSWGRIHDILRKVLYKNAFGIISQTTYSKIFLHKITNHKNIIIIPNPVRHKEENNLVRKNVILSVGRLIFSKRIDLLLEIFADVNRKDFNLWILGDGPEYEKLVYLAKELNILDRVTFWGSRKDVNLFYGQAKIFAFTSISEGFPNVLLEALASGLPSISFDCIAGPSDLIDDGQNGFLIPLLDIDCYKAKLNHLMDDQVYKQLVANTIKSSKRYDIDNIGKIYLNTLLS
jgi:GalNAc-alpha-(1->4)-GalNAc-alpha-(1->3)-diNAcBac-PP-undecaprenol alpha-1,4-N-acetyl-D-galactosaminyltransferase